MLYHNVDHTRDVYEATKNIAAAEGVTDHDLELLLMAAAYHDTGFCHTYQGHEEEGVRLFKTHFPQVPLGDLQVIEELILATKVSHIPQNQLEEIIRDADLDYLGREDFPVISENLYDELRGLNKISSKKAWHKVQLNFLKNHHYYTAYSRTHRAPGKAKNLESILLTP
ncbi:MAG: HD domain-containing protein [Marinoscillum sp.]